MKQFKYSRSHIETFNECPRKGFLQYYYNGTGIVRGGVDIYQATGSLIHKMMEYTMAGIKKSGNIPNQGEINAICRMAIEDYKKEIIEKGFTDMTGSQELEIARQSALAEGLYRLWIINRLPKLLEDYEVIAVEEEHEIPMTDGQILMSRMDCAMQRKSDGEIFAGPEFKKTAYIKDDYFEAWRYSIQTLSHGIDVEFAFGKKCAGVMMEYLYTGIKRKDDDGVNVYYSPLVRAFSMVDDFGNVEFGFDSGLARKKSWTLFEPYAMGMETWIQQIPQELVDGMLFNNVIYRNDREVDIWKRQTIYKQAIVNQGLMILADNPTEEAADSVMDQIFPANMDKSCYRNQYRKSCPFKEVCFGENDDPIGSGRFIVRTPHHEKEFICEEEE